MGVDVSRFGLMLVVGQPKSTAEYIQASSRVGRDASRPGLVVTLYNWSRPRDLAHYEDFEHYHATFYRRVEALSVTPFTRRALDRGVAATYVAALRQASHDTSRNLDAHHVDLEGPLARDVERRLLERAERVGGDLPRQYLSERLDRLKDEWRRKRDENSAALGYRKEKHKTTGDPSGGGPDWNFGAAGTDTDTGTDAETDRDLAATVDSDEYGPTTADTHRKAQR